jgi:peptidoglycan/LPS O-acetylase OafA/YrhL
LSVAPAEVVGASSSDEGGADRLPHLPPLDGLRGLAVAVVVLFHLDLLRGGWLGVDVFFVLSGFLITRLLVHERASTGRTDLRRFWQRRARRLLPALVGVLVGVALYAWWYPEPSILPTDLPGQLVATVAYVANWFQLRSGAGYWDQFATPSPLEHMWSLAIEEQFYVLFPLLFVALVGARRAADRRVGAVLAGLTVASWGLGVALLASGASFERVYLGTDTRVGAILCGATAGWLTARPGGAPALVARAVAVAPVALAVVVAATAWVDGEASWSAARWLLLPAFELAVVVVLLATVASSGPASSGPAPTSAPTNRILSLRPLTWLGGISYGLYLWHIPVILVAERALRDQPRAVVVGAAIVASLAIAQASAVLVEQPIRRRGLAVAPRFVLPIVAVAALAGSFVVVREATEPARSIEASRTAGEARVELAEVDDPGSGPTLEGEASLPLERPDDRPPRVLLLGDSLARDLGPVFVPEATDLGVTPSEASFVGCGDGGMEVAADRPDAFNDAAYVARCDAWRASFGELVARAQPDVVVVLRASARRTIPGSDRVYDRCEPEWLAWYREEMAAEVEVLGGEGSAVALATRPYNRFGDVIDEQNDREVDCMNAVLREVADADPQAVLLPINEWVCPTADTCRKEQDGVVLREDGLHFRGEGGVLATRWMLDELFGP